MKDNENNKGIKSDDMIVVRPLDKTAKAMQETAVENFPGTGTNGSVKNAKTTTVSKDNGTAKEPDSRPANEERDLKDVLQEQAREDEEPLSTNFTLPKILGGDILTARLIRSQIWLIVLIVGFIIVYISNRYSVQQDLLEIDNLNKELKDAKYKALSSSSILTEKCRESNILNGLRNNRDSILKIPSQPPYIINVPE